jgi:hypothetical protein
MGFGRRGLARRKNLQGAGARHLALLAAIRVRESVSYPVKRQPRALGLVRVGGGTKGEPSAGFAMLQQPPARFQDAVGLGEGRFRFGDGTRHRRQRRCRRSRRQAGGSRLRPAGTRVRTAILHSVVGPLPRGWHRGLQDRLNRI